MKSVRMIMSFIAPNRTRGVSDNAPTGRSHTTKKFRGWSPCSKVSGMNGSNSVAVPYYESMLDYELYSDDDNTTPDTTKTAVYGLLQLNPLEDEHVERADRLLLYCRAKKYKTLGAIAQVQLNVNYLNASSAPDAVSEEEFCAVFGNDIIPEEDFIALNLKLKRILTRMILPLKLFPKQNEDKNKVRHIVAWLLYLDTNSDKEKIDDLFVFLKGCGFTSLEHVWKRNPGDDTELKNDFDAMRRKEKAFTRFTKLRDVLQQLRPLPSPVVTESEAIDRLNQVLDNALEQWWTTKGQHVNLDDIKLNEYDLPDEFKVLNEGRTRIVKHPSSRSDRPSLLLSGLPMKEGCDIENEVLERSPGGIASLFGVSGIGKTRRIFEILSRRFGFYFSTTSNSDRNPTSNDFATARIKMLCDVISIADAKDPEGYLRQNAVGNHVDLLLLCRGKFLMLLIKKWDNQMTALQWLLIQLFPERYLAGDDLFTTLYTKAFQHREAAKRVIWSKLLNSKPNKPPIFVDESQLLQHLLYNRFPSPHNEFENNSLLSSVGKAFRLHSITWLGETVLTGTGFRMTEGVDEYGGGVAKPRDRRPEFSELPPFKLCDVKAYMESFLDLNGLDSDIVEHCCRWLVGRPRWTATFLEMWMSERHFEDDIIHPFYSLDEWNEIKSSNQLSARMFITINHYVKCLTTREGDNRHKGFVDGAYTMVKRFAGRAKLKATEMNANSPLQLYKDAVLQFACAGGVPVAFRRRGEFEPFRYVEMGLCCWNRDDSQPSEQNMEINFFKVLKNSNGRVELMEPLIVEASINYFGWFALCNLRLAGVSDTTGASGQSITFEHYCVAPILYALFNGKELAEQPALGNAPLTTEFGRPWRIPATAYGVLIANNTTKEKIEPFCAKVTLARFEGSVAPFSSTDTDFGCDLIGHVVSDRLENVIDRKFVCASLKIVQSMTAHDDLYAHLTTIPELIWLDKRTEERQLAKGVDQARYDAILKCVRSFGGVFRVIIKTCDKNFHKGDKIQPGCLEIDLSSHMKDHEFKRYESGSSIGTCDCLLVVDGSSLKEVLCSSDKATWLEGAHDTYIQQLKDVTS